MKYRIVLLFVVCIGRSATTVQAQQGNPQFTSAYTALHTDCKIDSEPARGKGGGLTATYKGYGGYKIVISYSVSSAVLSVADSTGKEVVMLGTEYSGIRMRREAVEWRMVGGKPFAIIFRMGNYGNDAGSDKYYTTENTKGSRLVIKGLSGFERIDFSIDGAMSNATAEARKKADAAYKP